MHFADPRLADRAVVFLAGTAAFDIKEFAKTRPARHQGPTTDNYLIGRLIPIGLLADLSTGVLDVLEYWSLYEVEDKEAPSFASASDSRHVRVNE